KCGVRQIAGAGHVSGPDTGSRLRVCSRKSAGASRIDDLAFALFHHAAHFREADDLLLVEFGVEYARCYSGDVGCDGATVGLPAVKTTIQNIDLIDAHDAEHPPRPRSGEETRTI